MPTITPGLLPGEVLISIPGAGTVDAINYTQINITDVSPLVITPGPAVSINSVEGFQLVNAIVGTFTAPILPPVAIPGLPRQRFHRVDRLGRPVPRPRGRHDHPGRQQPQRVLHHRHAHLHRKRHLHCRQHSRLRGRHVHHSGQRRADLDHFPPVGPTPGTPATATVTQGPLAVSAFPIVGTEGIAIPAGPIATFIDAGGAEPVARLLGHDHRHQLGRRGLHRPAASITQNGNAAQFTVNAPAFTLPEEGTYQVVVAVTDSGGATPITVDGASFAVIADAPLTACPIATRYRTTPASLYLPSSRQLRRRQPRSNGQRLHGTIDWGDGSPTSLAAFVARRRQFYVIGSHTYAKPGVYTVTTDRQGRRRLGGHPHRPTRSPTWR